jgi:hypothetical protein
MRTLAGRGAPLSRQRAREACHPAVLPTRGLQRCDARYLPSRKAVFDPPADAQTAYIGLK